MVDVTKSTNDLLRRYGVLLIGTAGDAATDELGYIDKAEGIGISTGHEDFEYEVNEYAGPVLAEKNINDVRVAAALAQVNLANWGRVMAISQTTGLAGGGYRTPDSFSARVICNLHNDRPVHLYIPNAVSWPDGMELSIKHNEVQKLMFAFKALDGTSGLMQFSIGSAVQAVTLATGVAACTKPASAAEVAHLIITSETASADALTDITDTLGAADDGKVFRVQPASGHTITVTHAGGTLELKGAANLVLDQTKDILDLYYDHSSTTLKELWHYLAP